MAYDKFTILTSSAVPLPIENVDTDQIIPARFLKATKREAFGDNLLGTGDITERYSKQTSF
jgi:3-isopropylmalate/(R)-2-methylmalate dehydratase small subunit